MDETDVEEVVTLSDSDMKQDPLFSATIKHTVEGKVFEAVVESIEIGKSSGSRLYRVRYSDGDLQHLTEKSLLWDSTIVKVAGDADWEQGSDLIADFRHLWTSGHLSDVSLKVQGEEVRAHKLILAARSPVFERMFATSMVESTTGIVQIEDMSGLAVRRLCEFMYTGSIEHKDVWKDINAVQELLHAAMKYEVRGLMCACASVAQGQITVANVVDWLVVASRAQAHVKTLKFRCIQFILKNLPEVQSTPGWGELMQNQALLAEAAPLLFRGLCHPVERERKRKRKPSRA
jgi:hypothetical protein